ncbi:tetratricopeptide (TPR) repeat protein [Filimonas zeae]|nr:hypothetical protein [Filimonas zeae]MDR6339091.1 tetratricopeptide (TPR) repeat protein [Filimonas zeae]
MRYVAGLIPAKARVLPDYFKGDHKRKEVRKPLRSGLLWMIGLVFLIIALAVLYHPLLSLLFAITGFVLIPPGARFLEEKLRCRLTAAVKAVVAVLLLAVSIPLMGYYVTADNVEAHTQELLKKKEAMEKAVAMQKEQQRKDSLHKVHEMQMADASSLFTSGKYADALVKINALLKDSSNDELLYNRAVCYSKTGKVREAVDDLKQLLGTGNKKATALYNKVNPVRRKIIGYCTRCWDGSTSGASGRGACSHHGGVKNWNEPIYQEYRQYE